MAAKHTYMDQKLNDNTLKHLRLDNATGTIFTSKTGNPKGKWVVDNDLTIDKVREMIDRGEILPKPDLGSKQSQNTPPQAETTNEEKINPPEVNVTHMPSKTTRVSTNYSRDVSKIASYRGTIREFKITRQSADTAKTGLSKILNVYVNSTRLYDQYAKLDKDGNFKSRRGYIVDKETIRDKKSGKTYPEYTRWAKDEAKVKAEKEATAGEPTQRKSGNLPKKANRSVKKRSAQIGMIDPGGFIKNLNKFYKR